MHKKTARKGQRKISGGLDHFCAERRQRQTGNLEKLFAEGNADDGDAPDNSAQQIAQSHGDAEEKNPDDIGNQGRRAATVNDILLEGTEGQTGKFEALASVRNPDDGDAPDQPGKPPRQSAQEPAEDEPENIADCFHTGYLERQNTAAQPHGDPIAAIKKV